jgi:hypothetical protein
VICSRLWLDLGIFATTRPNFNYFGHSHDYNATIRNFILLVGSILHLFSSINRLICPINHNGHQISCILKVFYNDIGVYFNVCTTIIYIYIICIRMYIVHIMNFKINTSSLKNYWLSLKMDISILNIIIWIWKLTFQFWKLLFKFKKLIWSKNWYFNSKLLFWI